MTTFKKQRNTMMRRSAPNPTRTGAWRRFLDDESGATAMEYGLMTALIGLTIIGTVNAAGQAIKDTLYGQIVNALSSMTK
jgi:pilus assembly protein Flp/PilA